MSHEAVCFGNEVLIMTVSDTVSAAVEKHSGGCKTLLVIDLSGADAEKRDKYLGAVRAAGVLTEEQIDNMEKNGALVAAVPFYTMSFASEAYRRIKHARHFVSLWVDGKKYGLEA